MFVPLLLALTATVASAQRGSVAKGRLSQLPHDAAVQRAFADMQALGATEIVRATPLLQKILDAPADSYLNVPGQEARPARLAAAPSG